MSTENLSVESGTMNLKRELGRKELMGIATGQIIGSGIMALVGIGIVFGKYFFQHCGS